MIIIRAGKNQSACAGRTHSVSNKPVPSSVGLNYFRDELYTAQRQLLIELQQQRFRADVEAFTQQALTFRRKHFPYDI